ncbi:MAG: Fic family protein [Bacillota bacterium]
MRWEINFNHQLGDLDNDIWALIIEIEAYKRSVLKIPLPPGLSKKINKINIIRQIKGTTGIEGNTLSEDEIAQIIDKKHTDQERGESVSLEAQEALNSEKVIEYIKAVVKQNTDTILTEKIIKDIHYLTTDGCAYPNNVPGEYRNFQNRVGEYLPPDSDQVNALMENFIKFINSRYIKEKYGQIIRAVLAHFYLVSIHPFGDGNGRTSRGIEAFILYTGGYNIRGFFSLANFYYKNRTQYIDELQKARFIYNGGLQSFVKFSLKGFITELEHVQENILNFVRIVLFKDYIEELRRKEIVSWRVYSLMIYLLEENQKIPLHEFKSKNHYIVNTIYEKYKGQKTLDRDFRQMLLNDLIIVNEGIIEPNISLLQKFLDN